MPGEALDDLLLHTYCPRGLKSMPTPHRPQCLVLERTGREARGGVRIPGRGVKSCGRPGLLGDSLVCAALTFGIPDLGSRQGYLRPGELFRCGPGPGRKSAGHSISLPLCCIMHGTALLLTDDVMMGNLVLLTGRGGEGVVWVRRGREKERGPRIGSLSLLSRQPCLS